jgi:hypothetical protein
LYARHTRRLTTHLPRVATALVFLTLAGCSDGPLASSGSGGRGGSGGSGGGPAGTGGSGSGSAGGTAGSDTGGGGGTGGGGDATGTGGSVGGSVGGSIGGSVGGQAGVVTLQPWPTSDAVVAVDSVNQFTGNLSDLVYQASTGGTGEVMWGLRNDPSTLYCLQWNGTTWAGMTDDGWTAGRTARRCAIRVGSGPPTRKG